MDMDMDLEKMIDDKLCEIAEGLCKRDSLHEWELRMLMDIQQRLTWRRHAEEELKNCSCIPNANTDAEPKPED